MLIQLKNSLSGDGAHRKLVIAYIHIGLAEDWRWYWKWSTGNKCRSLLPSDWPDFILTCDPEGWAGDDPVAFWDDRWKDIVIYGKNQGEDSSRDYHSILDEVIADGFGGAYLEWVSDCYGARYYWTLQDVARNPTGPSYGEEHATRGGDWGANSYIHSADRDFPEATSANFLGFRCAANP